jgi:peptidoglycan biosynthesis protein MviN/MurJ (putative lipid II flippase)
VPPDVVLVMSTISPQAEKAVVAPAGPALQERVAQDQERVAHEHVAQERPVDEQSLRSKHARAGTAMALATFAMAAASGLQALLYLRSFGVNARTDGFFAAFAVYASFGVFAQSLRITSAPLLVGDRPTISWVQFVRALGLIAIPLILVTGPGAGIASHLLAPGLRPAGRHMTEVALPILGVAMALQLWAAGAATLLAIGDRFRAIATAYALGAVAGLAGYLALRPVAGRETLAWSMLVMAVVTFAVMLPPLRRCVAAMPRRAPALRRRTMRSATGVILGRTAIYLAFNGLYLITLAVAGHYRAGDATIVSYAYLFASYLVAGTGFALGMARVADMTRGADAGRRDLIASTVPGGFRYAMLLSAAAIALLITAGAPLVGAVLPTSLSPHEVVLLQRFALLACPWLVAAQLVNLLLPALFALGRSRFVHICAPLLVLAHVGFTLLGALLFGVYGVVAAMFVAPLLFAAAMLGTEDRARVRAVLAPVAFDLARFVALAAFAFGGAYLLMLPVAPPALRAAITGVIGTIAYLAGLRLFAAAEVRSFRTLDPHAAQ